ncbi:MAG: trypco2 family protein [Pseudomonadota bacterium]
MSEAITLEAYISELRNSIRASMVEAKDEEVRFKLDEITVELTVGYEKSEKTGGSGNFKVFGVGIGAEHNRAKGADHSQRVMLKLYPVTKGEDKATDILISGKVDG